MSSSRIARWVGVLISIGMLLLTPGVALSDAPAISEDEFWARLARTEQIMALALSPGQANIPRYVAAQQMRDIWQGATEVIFSNGERSPIRLATRLPIWFEDSTPDQAALLLTRVRALLTFHQQTGRGNIDTTKAESALRDLARDPRFQYPVEVNRSPSLPGAIQGSWDLVRNILYLILAILALIGAVAFLTRSRLSFGWKRGRKAARYPGDDSQVDDPATVREADDRVLDAERRGDFRSAVRYRYLACLLRLDERRLILYDKALTNREYLLQTRENPILADALRPVVKDFDRVWYGEMPVTEALYQKYREAVERLERLPSS